MKVIVCNTLLAQLYNCAKIIYYKQDVVDYLQYDVNKGVNLIVYT